MDLLRLAGLAMLEGYGLQRALPEYHFRTAFLAAFLANLLLNALYSFAIYPFLVNPLRHLPTVKVFPPMHNTRPSAWKSRRIAGFWAIN